MIKMIRKAFGGTWLKVKTTDDTAEYWVRPSNPYATQLLKHGQIIDKECHGLCIFRSQDMSVIA